MKKRSIGTEHESSLHRSLKLHYADLHSGSRRVSSITEKMLGGYICDIITDTEVIEIQTGNFNALRTKIPALAALRRVRLIYPVIIRKTIELFDCEGKLVRRKKSPRMGTVFDIFRELVHTPEFIRLPRLTIELALVDVVERRKDDGMGSWRRKGVSIEDKVLEAWRESVILKRKTDWKRFLPLTGEFNVKEFAAAAHIRPALARKTLYALEKAGFTEKNRKEGRCWIYRKR